MEPGTNDNRNRPAVARNDDRASKTKASQSASATSSATSSASASEATATTTTTTIATDSLDAESAVRKLLTREEECTLKTALAFVVVRTRAKAAQQASSESALASASASASTMAYAQNRTKRHRIISNEERDTELLGSANNLSVLDHLFRSEENDRDSSIGVGIGIGIDIGVGVGSGIESDDREHLYGYQGPLKRPKPAGLLDCAVGDQNHINHMFRAAKRLSEALLVTKQKQRQQHNHNNQNNHNNHNHNRRQQRHPHRSRMPDTLAISRALAGATGHLAHQLQLFLTATATTTTKATTLPPPLASEAASAKPFARRRGWVASSGATACSTVTPTGSRITGSNDGDNNGGDDVAVVTPRTSNKHNKSKNKSKNKTKNNSENKRKASTNAEVEGNQVDTRNDRGGRQENNDSSRINDVPTNTRDSAAFVQDWIRSTLLLQPCEDTGAVNSNDTAARHGVTARNSNSNSNSNSNGPTTTTTVLHWHDATVLDVLASFHVYATLVPRVARISPGLAGHIARVVAKLVRDLYHDKIVVVVFSCDGGDGNGHGHGRGNGHCRGNARRAKRLLDHLATSALALLRVCWTTPCGSGGRRAASAAAADRNHRSFLLLSLHELLGELLVPLPRSELAREHYKLTLLGMARERERARNKRSVHCHFGQPPRNRHHCERAHDDDGVCRGLDPEAKLLLRMAVYRLLLE